MKNKPHHSNKKNQAVGKERENSATDGTKLHAEFPVVAIGASAGGIEAVTDLLKNLPSDTGLGFVLVQHLDPTHESVLANLLAKQTTMPVAQVEDGMRVEPNCVYVISPNTSLMIEDHTLRLQPRNEHRGAHMPIDTFLRSLAESSGSAAIGVILSGSGTDGTLGIAEIQGHGGVTFAQDDVTARYNSMPRSAVASGCVDYVLNPTQIARELQRIAGLPYPLARPVHETPPASVDGSAIATIFQLLRRSTGVDFTHYRQTTILRRIQRRMVVHKLDKLEDYVRLLHTNSAEIKALYQDMLINVTSFFRTPALFDVLKSTVFPNIMNNQGKETSIRVWTPGCASGEETYSIAIALLEFLNDKASNVQVQFFGTDISETSIAKARNGVYPGNIQADVSTDRLKRFFTQVDGGFRISKSVRDMCIFAQHNVVNDPPFSQMDLICCRNLLIYLEPVLQAKAISLFHYALRRNGHLVLGPSEGVGAASGLFSLDDRAHKIFSKKLTATRQVVAFSLNRRAEHEMLQTPNRAPETSSNYIEAQKEFDRRLLAQFTPATVFVNEDMEIVHSRGNVSRYLKLAPGRATFSVLKMAREGLMLDLRSAITRARKEKVTIRKERIGIKNGNGNGDAHGGDSTILVDIEVVPVPLGAEHETYFMIVFHDSSQPLQLLKSPSKPVRVHSETELDRAHISKLESELAATKEYLQSVIETHEATNEELQSANEEILSSNEELQSTNEELETAKEELQSANEELSTVNDELRSRNTDVTVINNDLTNLLSSIDIAVVMLGSDASVRRYTPAAEKLFGLVPADVGRPFINIKPHVRIPNLQNMILQVIQDARPISSEIVSPTDTFQLRILPYRTTEGRSEGAVVTLMALPKPKRARAGKDDEKSD